MMTASSTTLPAYPVPTMGNHKGSEKGGYMPWIDKKPCCMVDSLWEDCEHRIMCINLVLKVSRKMVRYKFIL